MRNFGMRAAVAGVLGTALVAVASPAYAADSPSPSPSTSPCPTTSPTATPAAEVPHLGQSGILHPEATPSSSPSTSASAAATTPAAVETSTTPAACAAAGFGAPATLAPHTSVPAAPTPTRSSAPGVITIPGLGTLDLNIKKDCDIFNSFSPVKVPCDAKITGLDSFVPNPLVITAKCGPDGPIWTITNTGTAALGYGWFDINLGGGIAMIAPGESQTLNSHSKAVIAVPWDAKTSTLLVAIPAVGYSTCAGGTAVATPPVAIPAATPATTTAVTATPHFTG